MEVIAGESGTGVRLLFIRHGNALRPSERGPDQVSDPPLSEQGTNQAAALVDRLRPLISEAHKVCMVSSPMLRCLHTAAPTATALGLELLIHGEFFEYGCAGTQFKGSGFEQIKEGLASTHGLTDLHSTHFKVEDGLWLYEGTSDKEQAEEAKARVMRLGGWVREVLVPRVEPEGVGIVVAHQTLLDLLLMLLLDGSHEDWKYGQPRYKLKNADLVDVEVTTTESGEMQFVAVQSPAEAQHPAMSPQLGDVFSQWAKGSSQAAEAEAPPLNAGAVFHSWASTVQREHPQEPEIVELVDQNTLFKRWSQHATAQHVEFGCVYRRHSLRRGMHRIHEELLTARQNHAAILEARIRMQQQEDVD